MIPFSNHNIVFYSCYCVNIVTDFWCLVDEYKLEQIVNLNGSDFKEESSVDYWPQTAGVIQKTTSGICLTLLKTEQVEHVTIRTLRLSKLEVEPHIVKLYQFQSWKMYEQVPWSREAFLHLICGDDRLTDQNKYLQRRPPILVHCMDGASQSGLFCACYISCQKMFIDKQVDIFHTVKNLKRKRLHFVNSQVNISLL